MKSDRELKSVPIRIAYVSPYSNFYGSERSMVETIGALNKDTFLPFVLVCKKGPLEEELLQRGIPCIPCYWLDGVTVRNPVSWFKAMIRLIQWLKDHKIQIVELNVFAGTNIGILRISTWLAGCKLILRKRMPSYWLEIDNKFWLSQVDRFVTVSYGAIKPWLTKRRSDLFGSIKPDRVKVIPSSRDIKKLRNIFENLESLNALGVPANKKIVGMVAAFEPNKCQHLFIEAAEKLIEKREDLFFVIIGTSYRHMPEDYENLIKEMVRQKGLEKHFCFTGYRKDAVQLMRNFSILVLPSQREALGSVLVEAMALGVSVVASSADGIPEVVTDEVTGLLVPEQKADLYAAAIEKLLNDEELAEKLRQNAKRDVERFDTSTIIKEIEKSYIELMFGEEDLNHFQIKNKLKETKIK